MAEKVSIELTVEQAQAVRAWMENNRAIVQNEESLRSLEDASKKASEASKQGFGGMQPLLAGIGRQALATATSFLNIRTAMQLVGQEIEANNRKNAAALNQQLSQADMRRNAYRAIGASGDLTLSEYDRLIEGGEGGTLESRDQAGLAALKEAAGKFSARRATDTALAASKLLPSSRGDEVGALASGAVSLQGAVPSMTPDQAVAFLLRASTTTGGERQNFADVGRQLAPAIGRGLELTGGKTSAAQLTAFYTGLAEKADVDIGQGVEFGERFLRDLAVKGSKAKLFAPGASLDEMLTALQGDSKEAKALRAGFDREAKAAKKGDGLTVKNVQAYTAIGGLLDAGSDVSRDIRQRTAELSDPAAIAAQALAFERRINEQDSQKAANFSRGLTAGLQQFRSDPTRALKALSRDELKELLVESGASPTLESAANYAGELYDAVSGEHPGTPEELAQGMVRRIRSREKQVRTSYDRARLEEVYGAGQAPELDPAFVRQQSSIAEGLDKVADLLEEQIEMMKKPPPVEVKKLPVDAARPQPPGAAALRDGGG